MFFVGMTYFIIYKNGFNKINCLRQLDGNAITHIDALSLNTLQNLKNLRLEGNLLEKIPTEALMGLSSLEALWDQSSYINFCSEQIIFIKYIGNRKQKPQQQKKICRESIKKSFLAKCIFIFFWALMEKLFKFWTKTIK